MAHAAALPPWLGIAAIGILGVVGAMLAGSARRFVLLGRLPRPSKEHWFLGSLRQMLHPRNHLVMSNWAKDIGGIYTFRILFTRVLCCLLPCSQAFIPHARHHLPQMSSHSQCTLGMVLPHGQKRYQAHYVNHIILMQVGVVTTGALARVVLGRRLGLYNLSLKALEP